MLCGDVITISNGIVVYLALLAIYAPKAAYSLTSILDNPDMFNARHIISASKEILDRTGLGVKTQMELEINTPTAMFFLPPKQGE